MTRREQLTLTEAKLVRVWARLDEIAAERGIDQAGPAWDVVRRMQRWRLRIDPSARVTADDFDRVTEGMSREDARLVRAYAVALDDPDEALRMISPDYNSDAEMARMLGLSIRRTAEQWHAE